MGRFEDLGMRAIVVSGGILGIAAVFGLGVVVGRFILTRDAPVVSAPTNAILGPSGMDNPLGDPNADLGSDPSINALPPAPNAPLPPATPPQSASNVLTPPNPAPIPAISARTESEAAIAASAVSSACNIRISKDAPIRSWSQKDRVTANAVGDSCGNSTIRITLETPEGASLYSLQAAARDIGISPQATADEVRNRISQLLPVDAVRAAAYPPWVNGDTSPTRSEFSRESYEAVRAANAPVTCLKMPNAALRCVASDPSNGQIKVFSRG
jgi:hypothetical protein